MSQFLSGWFMNAPFELLRRTEVLDLFAFGFWCAMTKTRIRDFTFYIQFLPTVTCSMTDKLVSVNSLAAVCMHDIVVRHKHGCSAQCAGSCPSARIHGSRYRDRSTMTEVEQQMVSDTLEDMERRFSFKIPEGTNPDLQFMAHLWQPLRVSHKPLFVHAISEVSVVFTHAILLYMGFQRQHISSFTYWTKHMAAPAPEPRLTKVCACSAFSTYTVHRRCCCSLVSLAVQTSQLL